MAQVPLFIENETVLRGRLRLTGVPDGMDADKMISNAILEVRANFIRRLGLDRINTLVAFTSSITPATEDESLRLVAEITELLWTKVLLMRTLTVMFLDGAGGALQDYQNESAFRTTGPFERDREIKRILAEIQENLELLEGTESIEDETEGHILLIESDTDPVVPGGTAFTNHLLL